MNDILLEEKFSKHSQEDRSLSRRGVTRLLNLAELELNQNNKICDCGCGHAAEKREINLEESVGGNFDGLVNNLERKLANLEPEGNKWKTFKLVRFLPKHSANRC